MPIRKQLLRPYVLTFLLAILLVYQYSNSRLQSERIAEYQDFIAQLQSELRLYADSQVDIDTSTIGLQQQIVEKNAQLNTLATELLSVRNQQSLDIEQLEQDIRFQLTQELEQKELQLLSKTDLLKQLTAMSPQEVQDALALHGIYGNFLEQLNVSQDRYDTIVNGLSNLIANQNQRHMDALMALAENPDNQEIFSQEILALTNPDSQQRALSDLLHPEELELYDQVQEAQFQNMNPQMRSAILGNAPIEGAIFLEGSTTSPIFELGTGTVLPQFTLPIEIQEALPN